MSANQEQAIELLLDHRADPSIASSDGGTALMSAARHASLSIVRKLIKHGADKDAVDPENGCTAFHIACLKGNADCAAELATAGEGRL